MKRKIISILLVTLLFATTIPAIGMKSNISNEQVNSNNISGDIIVNNPEPHFIPPWLLIGSDQKQLIGGYGLWLIPQRIWVQEFKPSKDKLTAVALEFFKGGNPPDDVEITVTIRNSLDGEDLAVKKFNADIIKMEPGTTWVLCDFEDITVTPEDTYYIMCTGSGGDVYNASYWRLGSDTQYSRGITWASLDSGETWTKSTNIDFCFITYWKKPTNRAVNTPFLNFLENHPILYQL